MTKKDQKINMIKLYGKMISMACMGTAYNKVYNICPIWINLQAH